MVASYFSKESQDRANDNLTQINDNLKLLICPFCEMKFNNLQTHLNTKHRLKIIKI
jgi:hypothetical protein